MKIESTRVSSLGYSHDVVLVVRASNLSAPKTRCQDKMESVSVNHGMRFIILAIHISMSTSPVVSTSPAGPLDLYG